MALCATSMVRMRRSIRSMVEFILFGCLPVLVSPCGVSTAAAEDDDEEDDEDDDEGGAPLLRRTAEFNRDTAVGVDDLGVVDTGTEDWLGVGVLRVTADVGRDV